VLSTEPEEVGPLTVTSARWHSGRLLVSFAEVLGRTDAETLRGVWLTVDAGQVALPQDPDEFHDSQLTGLTVQTVSGEVVGTVSDVLHQGQALLSVTPAPGTARHGEILVPFVAAIAVEVDLAAGKVVIDPPAGLLDLAPGDSERRPKPARGRAKTGVAGSTPGPDAAALTSGPGGAGPVPEPGGTGITAEPGGAGATAEPGGTATPSRPPGPGTPSEPSGAGSSAAGSSAGSTPSAGE
jgi:16S rRNA processing protein RimM